MKRNLEIRLAEEARAKRNGSLGWVTGAEQLRYVDRLKATDIRPIPFQSISAPEKAAVLGGLSAEDVAAGWVAWDGSVERQIPTGVVEIRLRNGDEENTFEKMSSAEYWRHGLKMNGFVDTSEVDIIAYRLAEPTQPAQPADPYQVFRDALAAGKAIQRFFLGCMWSTLDPRDVERRFAKYPPSDFRIAPEA